MTQSLCKEIDYITYLSKMQPLDDDGLSNLARVLPHDLKLAIVIKYGQWNLQLSALATEGADAACLDYAFTMVCSSMALRGMRPEDLTVV